MTPTTFPFSPEGTRSEVSRISRALSPNIARNNFSSAGDLELLISAIQKLSAFTDLGRRNGYKFASVGGNIYNTEATNKLLQSHSDIYAIKTGFTNEAHGAMATEIILDGHHVVILVLDSQNREADTLKLKENLEKAVIN